MPLDLVGPHDDVYDDIADQPGSHAYVDPDFDADHAAQWGLSLVLPYESIGDLVTTYHPDVVVEMLGVIDLGFFGQTPEQVEDSLRSYVQSARAADPGVDVVLVRQTQTWFPGVPELNTRITALAAELDTPADRVVVANADDGYDAAADTWDRSHPDARGELKIAAAVEDSLAGIGVGAAADRPIPDVPLGPRIAPTLAATVDRDQIQLAWTRSPGATATVVEQRDVTAGGDWTRLTSSTDLTLETTVGLGRTVQFRVRPQKGMWLAAPDAASNVVTDVVPSGAPSAPAPSVRVRRRAVGRATMSWLPVPEAATYAVQLRRRGRSWRTVATGLTGTGFVLTDLRRHRYYQVRAAATNQLGVGPWSGPQTFRSAP